MKNKKTRKIKRGKKRKFSKRSRRQRGGNQIFTNIVDPTSDHIYNNCINVFNYPFIRIYKSLEDGNYDIRTSDSKDTDNYCIKLEISDNNTKIYIVSLLKCSGKTGTSQLEKIKEFASMCGVKSIHITDGSSFLLCNRLPHISLSLFEILRTGISWYNRMGFVSREFAREQPSNNEVREVKLREVIDEMSDELTDNSDYYNPEFVKSISKEKFKVHRLTLQYMDTKLYKIFQKIYEDSKNNRCDDNEMITWFINLFLYIKKLKVIHYNEYLTYIVKSH
jgi:hypothetical protein